MLGITYSTLYQSIYIYIYIHTRKGHHPVIVRQDEITKHVDFLEDQHEKRCVQVNKNQSCGPSEKRLDPTLSNGIPRIFLSF